LFSKEKMDSEFLPEEDFGEDFGEKMDSPNEIPIRLSPSDDFQRTNFPADGQLRVIEVSSVPNLHSALAEASQEEERRKSTPDLSIVSRVREVSVESLMDWAHSFFDSRQCEPVQQQNETCVTCGIFSEPAMTEQSLLILRLID
jgi:hypothetical protein